MKKIDQRNQEIMWEYNEKKAATNKLSFGGIIVFGVLLMLI